MATATVACSVGVHCQIHCAAVADSTHWLLCCSLVLYPLQLLLLHMHMFFYVTLAHGCMSVGM